MVPLPYLIQQQKYNLTDEILERIRTYKDFNDLFDKLEKEDKNNQVVVEILDPNVSMISKDDDSGSKTEIQDKRPSKNPDYLKGKNKDSAEGEKDEDSPKSSVDTDYVVYGDGQFTFRVVSPEDRDEALKKLAKSNQKMIADMKNEGKDSISGNDKKAGKEEPKKEKGQKSDDKKSNASYFRMSHFLTHL